MKAVRKRIGKSIYEKARVRLYGNAAQMRVITCVREITPKIFRRISGFTMQKIISLEEEK